MITSRSPRRCRNRSASTSRRRQWRAGPRTTRRRPLRSGADGLPDAGDGRFRGHRPHPQPPANGAPPARLPVVALTANAVAGDQNAAPPRHGRLPPANLHPRTWPTCCSICFRPAARSARPVPPAAAAPRRRLSPLTARSTRALDAIRHMPGPNGPALARKVVRTYLADTPPRIALPVSNSPPPAATLTGPRAPPITSSRAAPTSVPTDCRPLCGEGLPAVATFEPGRRAAGGSCDDWPLLVLALGKHFAKHHSKDMPTMPTAESTRVRWS